MSLIDAATDYVQTFTGRQLVSATRTAYMDVFPSTIYLDRPPLQSITSVKYYDNALAQQTLAAAAYKVDTSSTPGRVSEAYSYTWPSTCSESDRYGVVQVAYVCGYSTTSLIPEAIKIAIKLLCSHWYENREAASEATLSPVPMCVESLLIPYKVEWHF